MPAKRAKPDVRICSSQSAVPVARKRLADLIEFVAAQEGVELASVDLAVVGGPEIARMNRSYLGHVGATDVLSFDLSDAGARGLAVQLVVCGPVARRQGPLHGQSARRELMLYVVHGLLHMMSHEDQTVRGAARMHAREDEILDAFEKRPKRG